MDKDERKRHNQEKLPALAGDAFLKELIGAFDAHVDYAEDLTTGYAVGEGIGPVAKPKDEFRQPRAKDTSPPPGWGNSNAPAGNR